MARTNLADGSFEYAHFGINPEAMPAWYELCKLQDENPYYPCNKNPYFYMDYDGRGKEADRDEYWLPVGLTIDDCESLCYGCPLLKQCYDFAVANGETHGIWGGVDMSQKPDKLF